MSNGQGAAEGSLFARELASAPGLSGRRLQFENLLSREPGAVHKAHGPLHFTASGIVVDATVRYVALHFHKKVRAWLQFGGHIDEDETSFDQAARREVFEESGLEALAGVGPGPLMLHPHALNSNFAVCSEHWDVQYLYRAHFTPRHATDGLRVSSESENLSWFALDALPAGIIEDLRPTLAGPVRSALAGHGAAGPAGSRSE